jgi:membrane-bound metal-dependent hydrolase YbcI (DUF457 family)
MAAFHQHVTVSTVLGIGYGTGAWYSLGFTPVQGALAGAFTALAGMLPDLDSDSGRPVKELFGLVAAIAPLLLVGRVLYWLKLPADRETVMLALMVLYMLVRYGVSQLVKAVSVHRGMFHSIPAMVIAGELAYISYPSDIPRVKLLMGLGVIVGFLSHLLMDELWSVQVKGLKIGLKSSSGTALKISGDDFGANVVTFALLATVSYMTLDTLGFISHPTGPQQSIQAEQHQKDAEAAIR